MDRVHESLEFREVYDEAARLMDEGLITVEKNCHDLRDRIKEQRKSIIDLLRANSGDPKKTRTFQATLNFHDHIRAELVSIEEMCHENRMKIRANLFLEIEQRLQPTLHCSLKAIKRAFELCGDAVKPSVDQTQSMIKQCFCNWTNVSPYHLEPTQDIEFRRKTPMPSKFDDSDLKFKQELMELRTKMFSMSNNRDKEDITEGRRLSIGTATKREFIETVKKTDSFVLPLLKAELSKVGSLKFTDGEFNPSDAWTRLLDIYGQQLRSKWHLAVRPQIERLLKRRKVTAIRLSPVATFHFIAKIPENGLSFILSREDLASLVEDRESHLSAESRTQFGTVEGKDFAATVVQSCWRGYWVRKRIYEAECKYIAASIIWVAWIVVKKKRQMHQRYLRNMLTSLTTTRELCLKLSNQYNEITKNDHVVIHLPSIGFPLDIRRTFGSKNFAVLQNSMALKFSFLKNPRAEVIYVMPVKLTSDLQKMYRDLIESICPKQNVQSRVTFLELSQAGTFADCSFNVSRTLHCSEDSLVAIRQQIAGKPAFCLPWIMDECDLRLAGNFAVPLLAPDIETQHQMLNRSKMSSMIAELGLEQPAYVVDIKDYATLCDRLAEQLCLNTEICMWLFKLNVGLSSQHVGIFLINHISVPFMPILRKEREAHGDEWRNNPEIRMNFEKSLKDHLPRVVSTVTRLTSCYAEWKDFYSHVTKYGCLLQAVPNEKSANSISVCIFIPGYSTGESPQWTGTAEKFYLASESRCSTFAYAMPQSTVDNVHLESIIGGLTKALQVSGYFGYLCVDLYCFPRERDERVVALVVETNPCYGQAQHFVDWMKFSIDGAYDQTSDTFQIAGPLTPEPPTQELETLLSSTAVPKWKETARRFGVAVGHLSHSRFSSFSWPELSAIGKECGIKWNPRTKRGGHLIFHDGTAKESIMLIAIEPTMQATLIFMKRTLTKLYKALGNETGKTDGNLRDAINFFKESSRNYQNSTLEQCSSRHNVL